MYEFVYQKVSSVDDAVAAMQKAEEGKFVAGGQTMLPTKPQIMPKIDIS